MTVPSIWYHEVHLRGVACRCTPAIERLFGTEHHCSRNRHKVFNSLLCFLLLRRIRRNRHDDKTPSPRHRLCLRTVQLWSIIYDHTSDLEPHRMHSNSILFQQQVILLLAAVKLPINRT